MIEQGTSFKGNGALVLTENQLWFSLLKPRKRKSHFDEK